MGLYIFIDENDRVNMREVSDPEIKEVFDEALTYDRSLMISTRLVNSKKNWFSKTKIEPAYTIYHEQFVKDGATAYQAREQMSASGDKRVVLAYLYGIINGNLHSGAKAFQSGKR